MTNPLSAWDAASAKPETVAKTGSVRFAFYGRCSTEDNQDPETSRAWQRGLAESLIKGQGVIEAEFFDVGKTRSTVWRQRPEANELLQEMTRPDRRFDALVVGEGLRCWHGNQFNDMLPLFAHFDVQVWAPELSGRYDDNNQAHSIIMSVTGGMSKNENLKTATRVKHSMKAQVENEGRFMGGRAPYGYLAVAYAPHKNPRKAAEGYKMKRLELDPVAAPVVRRIFDDYLLGASLRTIASGLNTERIACPSAHDPSRNTHRNQDGWEVGTVRAILHNSRYTGFEEWGKFTKTETLVDPENVSLGYKRRLVRSKDTPIRSERESHPAIVTVEEFLAVKSLASVKGRQSTRERRDGPITALKSVVFCGVCGRRMSVERGGPRVTYRCRARDLHGSIIASSHPKSFRVREDRVLPVFLDWLATDVVTLAETEIERLAATVRSVPAPADIAYDNAVATLADRRRRLSRLLDLVETGGDESDLIGPRLKELRRDIVDAERTIQTYEEARKKSADTLATTTDRLRQVVREATAFLNEAHLDQDATTALNHYLRTKGFQIVCHPAEGGEMRVEIAIDESPTRNQFTRAHGRRAEEEPVSEHPGA